MGNTKSWRTLKDVLDGWRLDAIERDAKQGAEALNLIYAMKGEVEQLVRAANDTINLLEQLRYEIGNLQEDNRVLNERLEILENKDEI